MPLMGLFADIVPHVQKHALQAQPSEEDKGVIGELEDQENHLDSSDDDESEQDSTPSVIYVTNGIAAEVQGHVITVKEVHDRMEPIIPELRKRANNEEDYQRLLVEAQQEALDSLVAQRLFVSKFDSMGAKIPRAGMNAYKEDQIKNHFGPSGPKQREHYHRHLLQTGSKSSTFQKKLEQDLEASIVSQGAYDGISENRLGPKELREFYDKNKIRFYQEAAVKLRMITLKPMGLESPEQLEQTATIIFEELKKGVSFEDLAKKYSQDQMASRGGSYGWVTRFLLRKDLFDVAFSLKPGEVSGVIRRDNMRYLLVVEDKHSERIQPFDDQHVQRVLHHNLYQEKRKAAHAAFLTKLREQDGLYVKYRL